MSARKIITDPSEIRLAIHKKIVEALKRKFPIKGKNYTANLLDAQVEYEELSRSEQSNLLISKKSVADGVFADLEITDNSTGRVVAKIPHKRIANIQYFTNRFTMMVDGNEYTVVNQMRTKSGVYTSKRGNDELESSFNLAKGANFKIIMSPDTGIFKIDILNSTFPAAAMLKILGAGDSDILNAIGKELADRNLGELTGTQMQRARDTLYTKLVKYKNSSENDRTGDSEKDEAIRAYFSKTEIDPETTAITLGKSYSSVTALSLLAAMKKILSVYNN